MWIGPPYGGPLRRPWIQFFLYEFAKRFANRNRCSAVNPDFLMSTTGHASDCRTYLFQETADPEGWAAGVRMGFRVVGGPKFLVFFVCADNFGVFTAFREE